MDRQGESPISRIEKELTRQGVEQTRLATEMARQGDELARQGNELARQGNELARQAVDIQDIKSTMAAILQLLSRIDGRMDEQSRTINALIPVRIAAVGN